MKDRKLIYFGLLALLVLAIIVGALTLRPAAQQPAGITLTDGLGRSVALAKPAEKIVSIAPSNTELLYAVGAGPKMIARDNYSNFPVEADKLPAIGDVQGFDLEKIVAMKPDLVLAAEINTPEQVKAIEDLGLTVYYLKNPTDLDGLYTNIETVASLTGNDQQAKTLVADLKTRVKAVEDAATKISEKPLVFYELDGTDPAKPWTAGTGTFLDMLLIKAAGRNAGEKLGSAWAQISQEELIVSNPDIILLGDATYGGMTAEMVKARPGWETIKAVKEGKIFPFNDDLVSRPGPRMVDGLEQLFKLLHPAEAGFIK